MIGQFDNLSYFAAAEDTPSIVSLRVIHPDTGKWMVKSELAKVFKALTLDMSATFPEVGGDLASRICFIGQPVLISNEEAVLRIALGSDSLRQAIADHSGTVSIDQGILQKMSFLGKRFNQL